MFKYLIITRNGAQFQLEEESGTTLYRIREFLTFLKDNYARVIFRKFKGRPYGADFADLDLVLIAPAQPGSALLGYLLEGFTTALLNNLEPTTRLSIPKEEFRIELTGRRQGGKGTELTLSHGFETPTKRLVALLRFDAIDPEWRQGTQARITSKQRLAFFIDLKDNEVYRGRRGTLRGTPRMPRD